MRELGRWQRSITSERSKYGSGGDRKSLLLIGCQTAELFTATGWRILPLYKGLCKSAACIKTQPSSRELTWTKDKHRVWSRQQLCFNPPSFLSTCNHKELAGTLWRFSDLDSCLHTLCPCRYLISFIGAAENGGHLIQESFIGPVGNSLLLYVLLSLNCLKEETDGKTGGYH